MKRLAGIWLILVAAAAAKADIAATLTVAPEQDGRLAPYATANLRLINNTPEAVETVLLRPGGGGPTVRYALAAAGGQEHTATIALPAISPAQKYEVTALNPAGKVLGTTWAEVTWPAECVAADVFLDDAYALWRDARAGFAGHTRRKALLLLAICVTAAAATLLIRRGPWRLAILGLLIAAGAVLAFVVPAWPGDVDTGEYHLQLYRGQNHLKTDSFAVLAARRTARVRREARTVPYPVYPDRAAAANDDARVDPARRSIQLTVTCGGVRIVGPARAFPDEADFSPSGLAVRGQADRPVIEGQFPFTARLVLRDDLFWPIPGRSARISFPLTPSGRGRIHQIFSNPDRYRLTREHVRLLRYWREKPYQQAGRAYLLGFDRRGNHFRVVVVEMELPRATQPASSPTGAAP